MIIDNRTFVILNSLELISDYKKVVESKVILNESGKPFSFSITTPPEFSFVDSTSFESFELAFYDSIIHNKLLVFHIHVNDVLVSMLKTYPNLEWGKLFNTPLSYEAFNSFIPQFKSFLTDSDTVDIANFIFHFVRDGFLYLDDRDPDSHGREKWTTPEEALAYPYLDCEDRSALFYYLIKEILNVPLIVLHYPDEEHVNVGLSLDDYGIKGDFTYKGRSYIICETTPTGESFGSNMLYKKWRHEIAVEYLSLQYQKKRIN